MTCIATRWVVECDLINKLNEQHLRVQHLYMHSHVPSSKVCLLVVCVTVSIVHNPFRPRSARRMPSQSGPKEV
jgi:hypothetical protein